MEVTALGTEGALTDAGDGGDGAKGPVELDDGHWTTPARDEEVPVTDGNDHGLKGVEGEAAVDGEGDEPWITAIGEIVAIWVWSVREVG
jgi:hypothetical protein